MIMSCDNNHQGKRAYRGTCFMCFWIEVRKSGNSGNLSQLIRVNPESNYRISTWPREANKRTPVVLVSREQAVQFRMLPNCVTAIRTGRNEVRRIAHIVRLYLSGTSASYDLFHAAAGDTILLQQGIVKLQGEKSTSRRRGLQSLEDDRAHSSDATAQDVTQEHS